MKGRPARPAEEQALLGNPGHRPVAVAPLEVLPRAAHEPPDHLSDRGKEVWRRIAPGLIAANILRDTDVEVFSLFVEALGEFWTAAETCRVEGMTYETVSNHGTMKRVHPAYVIMDRSRREATRLALQFGLTPAARVQLFAHLARKSGLSPNAQPPADAQPAEDARLFDDMDSPIGALN